MFTVKLLRSSPTRIRKLIEAENVEVNIIRHNELTQLVADGKSFSIVNAKRIANVGDLQQGDPYTEELWHEAYVENSSGSTSEQVKFS